MWMVCGDSERESEAQPARRALCGMPDLRWRVEAGVGGVDMGGLFEDKVIRVWSDVN